MSDHSESREQLMLEWANIKDAVASPYYSGTLFNNISKEFIESKKSIPGYARVFGSLSFAECDHSRSILGPAAYFVDLMRLVDREITDTEDDSGKPESSIPSGMTLRERRPDLEDLRLDKDNTYSLIPYIEIVNEILEKLIQARDERDAYEVLADSVHPEQLPFNRYLTEIRAYLEKLGADLARIYEAFGVVPLHVVRELLNLSPHELKLITTRTRHSVELSRLYNFDVLASGISGLENTDNFMACTGLSRAQLTELLEQDMTPEEIASGAAASFFINDVDDGTAFLRIEKAVHLVEHETDGQNMEVEYERITNLTLDKMDRALRFLRLARKLEWTFADLDRALRSNSRPRRREQGLLFGKDPRFLRTAAPAGIPRTENGQGLTLEARVKPLRYGRVALLARTSESTPATNYMLMLSGDGRIAFYHRVPGDANNEEILFSFAKVPLHEFSHVAAVIKGDTVAFYLNGETDRIVEKEFPLTSAADDILLMGDTPSSDIMEQLDPPLPGADDSHFLGFIKEVRLWNEARSRRVLRMFMDVRPGAFTPGLAAYWPMNEGRGRKVHDRTANRNDAISTGNLGGPTWHETEFFPGLMPEAINGAALAFDGDGAFAQTEYKISAYPDTTLETWVYIAASRENPLLTRGDSESGAQTRLFIDENNRPGLALREKLNGDELIYVVPREFALPLHRFVHLAVTIRNNRIRFFINGVPRSEVISSRPPIFSGPELIVGGDGENLFCQGRLRETRVWNIARDEEELRGAMNHRLTGREPGLRACWPLDDGCGLFARDLSGEAHLNLLGSPNAPNWITPESHPMRRDTQVAALQFDGTNYASRENASNSAWSTFTMEAWVRPDEEGCNVVFSKGDSQGVTDFLLWLDEEGHPAFYHGARGGRTENIRARDSVPTGIFAHLAVVVHEGVVVIFVNGRAEHRATLELPLNIDGDILNVGRSMEMERFRGLIRDVRLWNVPRTDSEIRVNMFSPISGNEEGLVGYWPISEGEGSTVGDKGPHGNHLELGGGDAQNNPEWLSVDFAGELSWVRPGFALEFDGKSTRLTAELAADSSPGGLGEMDQRTVEVWFRPASENSAKRKQVLYHEGDAASGMNLYLQDGVLYGAGWGVESRDDGDWAGTFLQANGIKEQEWNHAALTLDFSPDALENTFHLILNGEVRHGGKGGRLRRRPETVQIGAPGESSRYHDGEQAEGAHFAGALKEVRVWNRALPPGELNAWMRIPVPSERREGLDLWLPIHEGTGVETADYSGRESGGRLGDGERGHRPEWIEIEDNPMGFSRHAWRSDDIGDGDDHYVDLPAMKAAKVMTFEGWIRPAHLEGIQLLLGPAQGASPAIFLHDNMPALGVIGDTAAVFAYPLEPLRWYHIAVTIKGGKAGLLVNGRPRGTIDYKGGSLVTGSLLRIGDEKENAFRGLFRDFRLWRRALDEDAINSRMYRPLRGGEGGIIGAWALSEGSGSVAYDVSPGRNDGTYNLSPIVVRPAGPGVRLDIHGERPVLSFDGRNDLVVLDEDCCARCSDLEQHTVEIMFSPLCVTGERTALLYARGSEKSGLSIHVKDGRLNMTAWGLREGREPWRTTISTDRIRTRGNHHAALILDIADPCDPGELRGYLDGEMFQVAECPAVNLDGHVLTLGGPANSGVLAHMCDDMNCFYSGEISEFRVWKTARSLEDLVNFADVKLDGDESELMLLWAMDNIRGDTLYDKSSRKLHGRLGGGNDIARPRLVYIPHRPRLPLEITNRTPANLADMKKLMETHDISAEILTCFWSEMKHRGRAAKDPLFDLIFNGEDFARLRWDYFEPFPLAWDFSAAREDRRDDDTRLRLRAALALSDADLTLVAKHIRQSDDEPSARSTLLLSSENLTKLFRLSRTARILDLSVTDCLRLMELTGIDRIRVQSEFSRLMDIAAELAELELTVDELAYLSDMTGTHELEDKPFTGADIVAVAETVAGQLPDLLLNEASPVPAGMDPAHMSDMLTSLEAAGILRAPGYVTTRGVKAADLIGLDFFRARNKWDFAATDSEDLDAASLSRIFAELTSAGFINSEGDIADRIFDEPDLLFLFPALKNRPANTGKNSREPDKQPEADPVLVAAGRALVALQNILDAPGLLRRAVGEDLAKNHEAQHKLMRSSLADLLGTDNHRVDPAAERIKLDTITFLGDMLSLAAESATMLKQDREASPSPRIQAYMERMFRLVFITDRFDFTIAEMKLLFADSNLFGAANPEYPALHELVNLRAFGRLKKQYADRRGRIAAYLKNPDFTTLSEITNLSESDVRETAAALGQARDIPTLREHERVFRLVRETSMPVKLLRETAAVRELSPNFYQSRADELLKVLKSHYTVEEWEKNYEPMYEVLAEARRDALVASLISDFQETRERPSADQLYELLLIDVQRAACWKTSRIQQAIASTQLYIQRVRMNLETGIAPGSIDDERWEWMKNYRVWEANRKVFLYPENYIEPDLRDNASPIFNELKDELMQGEIDNRLSETVYKNYLDKFVELARLKVAGSCVRPHDDPEGRDIRSMYTFGRTDTRPYVYYYRESIWEYREGEQDPWKVAWNPWKKIDLTIGADEVTPVFAYNRIFLFWVDIQEAKTQEYIDGELGFEKTEYRATIKYSYYTLNENWVAEQILKDDFALRAGDMAIDPRDVFWRKVYALTIHLDESAGGDEKLIIMHGPLDRVSRERLAEAVTNITAERSRSILGEQDMTELVDEMKSTADTVNDRAQHTRKVIASFLDDHGFPFGWNKRFAEWLKTRAAGDLKNWLNALKSKVERQPDLLQASLDKAGDTAQASREGANTNLVFTILDPGEQDANRDNANALFTRSEENLATLTRMPDATAILSTRNEDIVNNIDGVIEYLDTKVLTGPVPSEEEFTSRVLTQTDNIYAEVVRLIDGLQAPRDFIHETNTLAAGTVASLNANQSKPLDGYYPLLGAMALEPNLIRQDFGLGIQDSKTKTPSASWSPGTGRELALIESANPIIADYLGESPRYRELINVEPSAAATPLLHGLSRKNAAIRTVKNQPGWFSIDNGDAEYLMVPRADIPPISRTLRAQDRTPDEDDQIALSFNSVSIPDLARTEFDVFRLNTSAVHELSGSLFANGIDGLLSTESQLSAESDFARFKPESGVHAPRKTSIDFEGPFGLYYREIFFHVPFLIATRLNANRKFEEARRWFQYIFDPTTDEKTSTANPADRYWRHVRFRERTPAHIQELMRDPEALREYRRDPFDPHAIARLRPTAYPRAVVMKYIDNLLDHGDALFTVDTRESITEATLLYIMAYNLLGRRPEARGKSRMSSALTYGIIRGETDGDIEEFFTHLESELPAPSRTASDANPNHAITLQFCVMENETFMQYWDRVQDRLFKIRHCMNIEGLVRQLALFEPPLDPAALVRAFASGRDLSGLLADLRAPVPHYRFPYLIEKARSLAQTTAGFGSLLLSALEKKDAEELQVLRNTHEKNILELTITLKEQQRDEARENLASLKNSLKSAEARLEHYSGLKGDGLLSEETAQIVLQSLGVGFRTASGIMRSIAAAVAPLPDGGTVGPFPLFKTGGANNSMAAAYWGEATAAAATAFEGSANIVGTMGAFERREQDWDIQEKIAGHDIAQIGNQISAAEARLEFAEQDIRLTRKMRDQNREIDDFLRDKFSSTELYNWMITRMSSVYFQAYKIAYDWAKQAEKSYQFERITNDTHVNFGHWDGLRKGLLAGESLTLDINRLDKAYMRNYKRELEIERTISLAQLDPRALLSLRRTGVCEFSFGEDLFDYDFPGHYGRRIKNLTISIPAVVGPYENLKATLTQLGNRTLLKPDLAGAKYLLGIGDAEPDSSVLRSDWRSYQQIAVSTGVNDAGLFELNFRDERYLPFEGTGAVSNWRLEMPKAANRFDFESIADVILRVRYQAYSDQGSFREGVRKAMKKYAGHRILFMSREFSTAWHVFLNPPAGRERSLQVDMSEDIFPHNLENIKLESVFAALLPGESGSATSLEFDVKAGKRELGSITASEEGVLNPLSASKFLGPWTLTPRNPDALGDAPPGDLVLVLRFEGKLDWGEG